MLIGVIDIETTGFLKQGGLIVEIGMVSLDTDTHEIKPVFDSRCREKGLNASHRDAWIFQNSDLKAEDVRNAPMLEDLQEGLQGEIDKMDAITAYNRDFDIPFLQDRGFNFKSLASCPMKVSTPICKIPHKPTKNKKARKGNKWPNFEEAWAHFCPDAPYIEAHRA